MGRLNNHPFYLCHYPIFALFDAPHPVLNHLTTRQLIKKIKIVVLKFSQTKIIS